MSTSHEWAMHLQKEAAFLLSRPEVEIGKIPVVNFVAYMEKEYFLNLVRALKPGRKRTTEYYIHFYPKDSGLELSISRSSMCKRLNPEYECTPLLSKEEDAEMEVSE